MGYATLSDVANRDTLRGDYTANTKPSSTQVIEYLEDASVTLDGLLRAKGYQLPVTATSALRWLRSANADGAYARVQAAATEGDDLDESAQKAWEAALKMLREGHIELEAPRDLTALGSRTNRDPVQLGPHGGLATWRPAFTRDMEL